MHAKGNRSSIITDKEINETPETDSLKHALGHFPPTPAKKIQ